MSPNTIWVNKLFYNFINNSQVSLFFEEKEKLREDYKTINLSIHPIRFADDVFFNFETNDQVIKEKLKKYEVNYNIFYHYADIVKASCLKTANKNSINEKSLLLVGQTDRDKVVFNGEKYLTLLDYIEEIKRISKNYDSIYFKPHPYAKNTKRIYKALKNEFKNIYLIQDNVYHLLSNDNIQYIIGLNSSVLYEAKYFKKEVAFLYKHTFDFSDNDIGIYGNYFSSDFWSDILGTENSNISIPFVKSRTRVALNDFWGYNEISDEIVLKNIFKTKIKYILSRYIR